MSTPTSSTSRPAPSATIAAATSPSPRTRPPSGKGVESYWMSSKGGSEIRNTSSLICAAAAQRFPDAWRLNAALRIATRQIYIYPTCLEKM